MIPAIARAVAGRPLPAPRSAAKAQAVDGARRKDHIPSDFVVDQWASAVVSSSYPDFLLLQQYKIG
jgi:hypothetical protein